MLMTAQAFLRCKNGGSAAEYALILSLVCVALVSGATLLGTAIAAPITSAASALTP